MVVALAGEGAGPGGQDGVVVPLLGDGEALRRQAVSVVLKRHQSAVLCRALKEGNGILAFDPLVLRDLHGAHRGLVHGGTGVLVDLVRRDRGRDAVPQLLHPHDAVFVNPQRRSDGKQDLGEVIPGAAAVAGLCVRVAVRQIAVQLAAGVYALDHHLYWAADLGDYLRHRLAGVNAAHVAHGDESSQCGEGGERIGGAADPLHRLEIVHAHPAAIPEILHFVIFGKAHDGLVIGKHRNGEAVGLQAVGAEGLDLVQAPGGTLISSSVA